MGDGGPGALRLFAAVEIPGAVADALRAAIAPLRERHRALRWTDPDGWHLTLAFMGSVPAGRLEDVRGALARAAARSAPFPLALTGAAGTFRSGALWAAIADAPALARLAAETVAELQRVVPVPDAGRPFRPHLTLARSRARGAEIDAAAASYRGPDPTWTVERVVLMRSYLRPRGAYYEVVGAWPLGEDTDA